MQISSPIYFAFRLVYRASRWFDRRFTRPGKFIVSFLVMAGALGVDTRLNVAHQAFTMAVAFVLVSILWSMFFRFRFTAVRNLPRFTSAGQPLIYQMQLTSQQAGSEKYLELTDELGAPLSADIQSAETASGMDRQRNWFDRKMGYIRWAAGQRRRLGAYDAKQLVQNIPARVPIKLQLEIIPLRRGYLRFSQCTVSRTDPLGLVRSRVSLPLEDSVLVLPQRYRVPAIDMPGSRRFQQGGVTLASEIGESDEFVSLRDYRPGDPIRHIHWKSLARSGKPVVKQYQDEYFSRHALVLDTFTSDTNLPAFETAVSVAASFAAHIDTNESLLDLLFVGSKATCVTAGRSLGRVDQLLEVLASVSNSSQPFDMLSHSVLAQSARLSGCILVLLDWDEQRQQLVGQLGAANIPCMVLVVNDTETSLDLGPMAGQPDRFHHLRSESIEQDLASL